MIYFITDKTQIEYYDKNLNFTDIETCISYLKDKKVLGLDIETSRKYKKYKYFCLNLWFRRFLFPQTN